MNFSSRLSNCFRTYELFNLFVELFSWTFSFICRRIAFKLLNLLSCMSNDFEHAIPCFSNCFRTYDFLTLFFSNLWTIPESQMWNAKKRKSETKNFSSKTFRFLRKNMFWRIPDSNLEIVRKQIQSNLIISYSRGSWFSITGKMSLGTKIMPNTYGKPKQKHLLSFFSRDG